MRARYRRNGGKERAAALCAWYTLLHAQRTRNARGMLRGANALYHQSVTRCYGVEGVI